MTCIGNEVRFHVAELPRNDDEDPAPSAYTLPSCFESAAKSSTTPGQKKSLFGTTQRANIATQNGCPGAAEPAHAEPTPDPARYHPQHSFEFNQVYTAEDLKRHAQAEGDVRSVQGRRPQLNEGGERFPNFSKVQVLVGPGRYQPDISSFTGCQRSFNSSINANGTCHSSTVASQNGEEKSSAIKSGDRPASSSINRSRRMKPLRPGGTFGHTERADLLTFLKSRGQISESPGPRYRPTNLDLANERRHGASRQMADFVTDYKQKSLAPRLNDTLKKTVDAAGSMSLTMASIDTPTHATTILQSEGGAGAAILTDSRKIELGAIMKAGSTISGSRNRQSKTAGENRGKRSKATRNPFVIAGAGTVDRDFRKAVEEHLAAATASATSNISAKSRRNDPTTKKGGNTCKVGKGGLSLTAGNSIGLDMSEFDKKGLLAASFCAPKFGTESRQTKMRNTFQPGPGSYTPLTTSSFTFTRDERMKVELHGKNTNAPGSEKSKRKSSRMVKSTFGISKRLDFYQSLVAAGFASDSAASPASYSPAASVASTFASTTHNAKLGFEPLTQLRKSETISSFVHTAASLTRPTSSLERGSSSVPQLA